MVTTCSFGIIFFFFVQNKFFNLEINKNDNKLEPSSISFINQKKAIKKSKNKKK